MIPRRVNHDTAPNLTSTGNVVYCYLTVGAAVGLIGLGNMGAAFAERLLDAGYPLVVHNRTPAKAKALAARGATVADTPAALAGQVDVILTSLANDDALDAVSEEVLAVARPGSVLVYTSTVSP